MNKCDSHEQKGEKSTILWNNTEKEKVTAEIIKGVHH